MILFYLMKDENIQDSAKIYIGPLSAQQESCLTDSGRI